uniref:Uncharacterized protein n=1 Tax=Schistocephalus solidus TaxID=70667 RepID=A0A0V0J6R5_SCHSO
MAVCFACHSLRSSSRNCFSSSSRSISGRKLVSTFGFLPRRRRFFGVFSSELSSLSGCWSEDDSEAGCTVASSVEGGELDFFSGLAALAGTSTAVAVALVSLSPSSSSSASSASGQNDTGPYIIVCGGCLGDPADCDRHGIWPHRPCQERVPFRAA